MKKIKLTQNKFALIDDDDFEKIITIKWHAHKYNHTFYAVNKNKKTIAMHRFIVNAPKNKTVDHINHNGLDNRKENLRICTKHENLMNKKPIGGMYSKLKGVTFDKRRMKWVSQIRFNRKTIFLGYCLSALEAAQRYDKKAIELFGQYACVNFK